MKKIFASQVAVLDSNVYTGGGTDVTAALQAALDQAVEGDGVHLVVDGAALIHGLKVHSNTVIECTGRDCGFYMADYANRPMLTNSDWSYEEIRSRNITIQGGTYNHNCRHQAHHVSTEEYPNPMDKVEPEFLEEHGVYLMEFYGMEDLTIRNVTFRNQRTYTLTLGNFKNVLIERSTIEMADHVHPSNQDGFHFFGPGQFLTMRDIRGCTGDDFINLGADEFDGKSSITDVLIDGMILDGTCQGVRMLAKRDGRLDRVTVRNVTGTYRTFAFSIIPFWAGDTFGHYGDLFFENIDLRQIEATYHYTPLTFFHAGGNIDCLTLKNVRFHMPVRNSLFLDFGRPFFYRPPELTDEEMEFYGIVPESYLPPDWMPETARPHIRTLIVDGCTIDCDEKFDGAEIMELRYRIDNCIVKNFQLFRSGSAAVGGGLIRLCHEAQLGNLIVEDVFAEKLTHVISAGKGHSIDCLKCSNISVKGSSEQLFAVDGAKIGHTVMTDVCKLG